MAKLLKRETLSRKILEQIDSNDDPIMVIKNVPSAAPLSYTGTVPFVHADLYKVEVPDQTDAGAEPMLVAEFEKMRWKLTKRRAAMPYTRRHIDADEIFFIHRGKAKILTEVGIIDAPAGRLIFISRGIGYRVEPETDDFMAMILESEEPISRTKGCKFMKLEFLHPAEFVAPAAQAGEWEERMVTIYWSATAMRPYDPLQTQKIVGNWKPVFAIDVDDVPASSADSFPPGLPFEIFESRVFGWQISKRADPLPFYHRNNRRNEVFFVHEGGADQDTDLGRVYGPPGSFYTLPMGVEHSPCNRKAPLVNLILETDGDIKVNPEILKA